MTGKRMKKLLMAKGISRNNAEYARLYFRVLFRRENVLKRRKMLLHIDDLQGRGGIAMSKIEIRPCDFATASEFVNQNHRHRRAPVGQKFSIVAYCGDKLCGVAMVGRPISRYLDDGLTLEVNRCCTDAVTRRVCYRGFRWKAD